MNKRALQLEASVASYDANHFFVVFLDSNTGFIFPRAHSM